MKKISGFNGYYEIDEQGNVFSIDRIILAKDGAFYNKKGRKLLPNINKQNGYPQVSLWINNKRTSFYVHRLVAEAYLPNPENKPEINHKNSNRLDPSISNLEWCTSSENSFHAYKDGYATQKYRRNLEEKDYLCIFNRFMLHESFTSIMKDFNISPGRLSITIRTLASKWGKLTEYEEERQFQRIRRARLNGTNN